MNGNGAGKDILVVDDDLYLCEIISDVLEAEGHVTRTAANGKEALERIRERKPQLILLDLMMPVMNGKELARVLKSSPDWRDIPIVVISAAHNSREARDGEIHARAIISKPFDIDELALAVQAHAS